MRCTTGESGENGRTGIALIWRFLASLLAFIRCATDVICFLQRFNTDSSFYS